MTNFEKIYEGIQGFIRFLRICHVFGKMEYFFTDLWPPCCQVVFDS